MELHASGVIDHSDAEIILDMQNPGSLFTGFGGNFRLQNPAADPKVIDYCLENLRVAYGRVEFPWRLWQPEEEADPIATAQNGGLNKRVEESLLMAKRLKAMGMPVILSCWFPPAWAIDGGPASYARQGGVIAYRLDNRKKEKIYKSMADYLLYAKRYYGIEFSMFSFNESDLGIDVLHTPQEHADFIKEFGAYLAGLNLPTRMLLGDNSVGEFYSVAMTNHFQQADTGTKMIHIGRNTRSRIVSKGISAGRSENSYRGLVKVARSAEGARNYSQCDSLLIGSACGAHTFPEIACSNRTAIVEHEATTSKISDEQLFYCNQRGLSTEDAVGLIVNGFAKEVMAKLPMEFAVEAQKLLSISLEGSVG